MRTKPEMMGQLRPAFSELNISEGFEFDTELVTNEIKEDCKSLLLSNEQLTTLMKDMDGAIRNGLGKDTNPSSIVKCYVTYVQDLPNGTERGKFLALDLGGTNFRVLLIELGENNYFHMDSEIFKVPAHIQTGKGSELFDHIAKCLAEFIKKHNLDNKKALPLGFTFSFPLRQVGLTKGYLNSWTKGFNCSGVVDEDVVRLLKEAIKRRKDLNLRLTAVLNDATGTLMSCAHKTRFSKNCFVGLIIGTGCNACYVEKVENAELFDGDKTKPHVIVNTEWGAFGDDGKLDAVRTKYDREIDEDSLNPGRQRFEKMISGMYMGEIVRLAIVDLANQNKLFEGRLSEQMKTKGAFGTSFVSDIEGDKANYKETLKVLSEMGINDPSLVDCANVRYICECVSRRSAHLVSAGLAALLNKMDEKSVTIGVDGSVYRFHPYFHKLMVEKTKQLTKSDIKFDLMLSEDGSGRGAALVAAVAVRDELPSMTNGFSAK
ncbi:hexokinase type 2 isoform X1 [Acyrthosiphon pisum]|uniref:Phosphotransferase n=1 Tax=Acyrthosiphon pisum TaxID=7029 RepID=A0A8R1W4J7_ACYPI|nr:hexokinase type 2 isoform X1 [Acyrthosiphon pisum]|eukprot:XP_003242238.1 PREDICTED: hexokinase type 2 isoform X1 [Acyrthosiphon pisum]